MVKLLPLLHMVLLGYILHDAVKSHPLALPMLLPPHEFIKVAGDLVCMAALHSLQLGLDRHLPHKRQPKRLDFIRNGEERHNLPGYRVLLYVTYDFLVSESEG